MFTMINWSASMSSPAIQASLDALMPDAEWKGRLKAVAVDGEDAAEAGKDILVSCINEVIGRLGNFPYVMETLVLFPLKDRTYYSLIYATRSTKGIEVFRDCQHDALKEQDEVRAALQSSKRDEAFGMTDMFGPSLGGNEFAARWMAKQEASAVSALLGIVPVEPAIITYGTYGRKSWRNTASAR
jgi:hypothetical protein